MARAHFTKGKTEKIAGSIGDRTGRGDRRVGGIGAGRQAAGSCIVGTFGGSTRLVIRLRSNLSLPSPYLLPGRATRHGVDTVSLDALILTVQHKHRGGRVRIKPFY